MQNHQNASFENDKYEILPSCDKNELFGSDLCKFQLTAPACKRKVRTRCFTLPLTPETMELSRIEHKCDSKMPEWHLNPTIKPGLQDDNSDLDICDLSGVYRSGVYLNKRCSKPLTSTPCSRKKRVSFKLAEDCSSMDDSGYDGSPSSEQESPVTSRKRNLEMSRYRFQDSLEEDLSGNLSLDLSNPRLCLLSRFDESDKTDSADVSYSSSVLNSSLTHLSDKQLDGTSEDQRKPNTGLVLTKTVQAFHVSPENLATGHLSPENTFQISPKNAVTVYVSPESNEAFHIPPQNTGTVHLSPKHTKTRHISPQNTGTVRAAPENTEAFHTSPEKSAPAVHSTKKLTADCDSSEKNDSGFIEDLSDLLDTSLNISNLNAASIFYAKSPEFCLARKAMSIKEYNDRLTMTLCHFAPPCLDRLIGRKMGLEKVDIVSELYFRNITGVLTSIMNYLSDDDLLSMRAVSIQWKATVKCISYARYKKHRLHQHPSRHAEQTDQENGFIERSEHRSVTIALEPLLQVQSKLEVKISTKRVPSRTELFWQEASKLKNHENLRKCPRCRYPSRIDAVQERAWCGNSKCLFDFCIKCLAPYHSLRPCIGARYKQTAQEMRICSKQSKCNLRRL